MSEHKYDSRNASKFQTETLETLESLGTLETGIIYNHVPALLKNKNRWVNFYYGGRFAKIPLNPKTLEFGSSTDPDTWSDFETARRNVNGERGLGFVLGDGIVGVDFDDCLETGKPTERVLNIVKYVNSYTEITPSDTGLHIICEGTVPKGCNKGWMEIYGEGRYFTFTGNHFPGTPSEIRGNVAIIDDLWSSIIKPRLAVEEVAKAETVQFNKKIERIMADRAKAYMASCPPAISGEGGHNKTLYIACRLVRLFGGLSDDQLVDCMGKWNEGLEESWTEAELRHKIKSARGREEFDQSNWIQLADNLLSEEALQLVKGIELPKTAKAVTAEHDPTIDEDHRPTKKLFPIFKFGTFDKSQRQRWIIKNFVKSRTVNLLFGPSNSGKSFLGIDWAVSLATGNPWLGNRVDRQKVLYIYAEAPASLWDRINGWFIGHGVTKPLDFDDWFTGIPCEVNMDDPNAVDQLMDTIDHYGVGADFVVIDTMDANMQGVESDTKDCKKFVEGVADMWTRLENSVLIIHHTGKNKELGAKGDNRLHNKCDSVFMLDKKNENSKVSKLITKKQRDSEKYEPIFLKETLVDTAEYNADGEPITSLILEATIAENYAQKDSKAQDGYTKMERRILASLPEMKLTATNEDVFKVCPTTAQLAKRKGTDRANISRLLNKLARANAVHWKAEGSKRYWFRLDL